jgi:hypothetical protein
MHISTERCRFSTKDNHILTSLIFATQIYVGKLRRLTIRIFTLLYGGSALEYVDYVLYNTLHSVLQRVTVLAGALPGRLPSQEESRYVYL